MNIFGTIVNGFNLITSAGKRIFSKALSVGTRIFSVTIPEVFSPIEQKEAISKGFNANICVYVVVKKDAVKFGSIPRYVYDTKSYQEKKLPRLLQTKAYQRLDNTALTKLINRPNPFQSQDAFYTLVRACYKVCGEVFIWCNRGDIDGYRNEDGTYDDDTIDRLPILEMYMIPPTNVSIVPDPSNLWGAVGYVLEIGERLPMRFGDVIHWKDINLEFDASSRPQLHGMSPVKPGSATLEESNSISRASMRMSQNDGAKAVLFNETMDKMTPEQQTQIKKTVDAKINNIEIAGQVAVLQGKWGVADLAMSSKDMEMIDKKKMSWREIALLFEVPPQLVDTDTKYDDLDSSLLQWVTNAIAPACKQLDGEMNRVLLKAFKLEGKAFIATDISDIPEVQASMIKMAKEMQEIWSITPDEVRSVLLYEPLGGKFAEPWVANDRTPLSESSMDDGTDELLNDVQNDRAGNQD